MQKLLKLRWRLLPLFVALLVLLLPVIQEVRHNQKISIAASTAEAKLERPAEAKIQGEPSRIIIPRLSIDLPVVLQKYSEATKTWPVSPTTANYAANTASLNNGVGQTLIYGHNNKAIFGPILKMKRGDIVYVYTKNNHVFKYAFQQSQDITPTKLSIFSAMEKADAGLKLITCNGPNFEYRHLLSLKLVQAS